MRDQKRQFHKLMWQKLKLSHLVNVGTKSGKLLKSLWLAVKNIEAGRPKVPTPQTNVVKS